MADTKLVTNSFRHFVADDFMNDVFSSYENNSFYFFVGNHLPLNSARAPFANNNQQSAFYDPYRNMIMGKKITQNDARLMIRNIPYVSNRVYAMYDDLDSNIELSNYYVIVNELSYYHVYKCLDNNNGAKSTITPKFDNVSVDSELYQTSDGYRWKYMYSIDSSTYNRFASEDYFPVEANAAVEAKAATGTLDIIKVEYGGQGYNNYVADTFKTSQIKYSGDPQLYEVANNVANTTAGYYTGCILYLLNGPGSGNYRRIIDYYSDQGKNIIKLDTAFNTNYAPVNGTMYQITPEVKIYGDGGQFINAVGRALVNPNAANSIYRVEILSRGQNYNYATANVVANGVVLVKKQAELRPILPPFGGHGSNAGRELNSRRVCLSTQLIKNEGNTILTTNGFRQVGIVKNPKFANVKIVYHTLKNSFIPYEKVYKLNPYLLATNAYVLSVSNIIECNTTNFAEQVSLGDRLYLKDSDESMYQIATVSEVIDNTHIAISSNCLFSCTSAVIYAANVSTTAYINNIESGGIYITDVYGNIGQGDTLIGESSGAQMTVDTIVRNDKEKSFDTFIQLYKYNVTLNVSNFVSDELVYQGNTTVQTANGFLHSVVSLSGPTSDVYVSNQIGVFANTGTIKGKLSQASATINNVYSPELVFGSGDIIYIENIIPVARQNTQSETFKLIIEF